MGLTVRNTPLICLLLLLFCSEPVAAAEPTIQGASGPLRVRNMSPVMTLYGTPRMTGARVLEGDIEATFNLEIANNFQSELRGDTFAFFDGETYIASYRIRDDLSDGWDWGLEIPWIVHTPGSLDGLVDEFHELFGLPDGDRGLASRNRLDYYIGDDEVVYADFNESRRGLGDIRASIGRRVFDDHRGALAVRGMVKVPTGEVKDLTGSGGMDVSLWAEYERAFVVSDVPVRMTGGLGITRLGDGDLLPEDQHRWMSIAHLGIQVRVRRGVEFHAQADAHTRPLDTDNPLAADGGVLGTIGGRIGITPRLWLDLSIIEDLKNEAASDVVFQFMLGARL